MARKGAEIGNSISLGMASLDESSRESFVIPFDTRAYPQRLADIYKSAISSLKILSIGALGEASDFFGSYESYVKMSAFFSAYGLSNGTIPVTDEEFSANPTDCWISLIIVVMSILYAMPNNGGVNCNRIVHSADNDKTVSSVGVVMNLKLVLEAYDWKEHLLTVYIPDDQENCSFMVLVDNSPVLFSTRLEKSTDRRD